MREISTEIEIAASAAKVWGILSNLSKFADWNPFIKAAEGEVKVGSQLSVCIDPPGGKQMNFKPTITRAVPESGFRWIGRLLIPGLFDGEHIFEIVTLGKESVRFIQREQFRGLLVPLFWRVLETKTRQGFNEMNAALKKEAEKVKD